MLAVLLLGCPGDESKDGALPEGETQQYAVVGVADGCDDSGRPAPRRYAHMSSFVTDDPISVGGRLLSRGIVLSGGDDGGGGGYDDLWVFDLTNLESEAPGCRWTQILGTGATGGGNYGGAFGFDPTTETFLLAGGLEVDSVGRRARDGIWSADLANLSAGFTRVGSLPPVEYWFSLVGDARCAGNLEHPMVDESCGGTDACYFDACSGVGLGECFGEEADHTFGCAEDPFCEHGESEVAYSVLAPGVWQAASWMDPEAGALYVLGGTTGCEGTDCADWDELFSVAGGTSESVTAANAPTKLSITAGGSVIADDAAIWDEVGTVLEDYPARASYGLRGSGAYLPDAAWDRATRTWGTPANGSDVDAVHYGGSWQQDLPSEWEYDAMATCVEYWTAGCPSHCTAYEGAWSSVGPWFADVADGFQDPGQNWMVSEQEFWEYEPVDPGSAYLPLIDAAMVRTGASGDWGTAVIVGGRDSSSSSGTSAAWIPGVATVPTPSSFGARYGASAAYDPAGQAGYVFGGNLSDRALYRVEAPETVSPGDNVVATLDSAAEKLTYVSDTEWVHESKLYIDVACETGWDCMLGKLAFAIPTVDSAEVATVAVKMEVDGVEEVVTGVASATTIPLLDGGRATRFDVESPFTVTGAETVVLTITWRELTVGRVDAADDALEFAVMTTWTPGSGSAGLRHFAFGYLAAWLVDPTAPEVTADDEVTLSSFVVSPPTGTLALSAGDRTANGDGSVTFGSAIVTPMVHGVLILDGGEIVTQVATVSGHSITVATDARSGTGTRQALDDYLSGVISPSLLQDVAWLETSLGAFDRNVNLVATVPSTQRLTAGRTRGVMHVVQPGYPDGTEDRPLFNAHAIVHELAHHWFLVRRNTDSSAFWTKDALCTLAAESRHATAAFDSGWLRRGALALIERGVRGGSGDVEVINLSDPTARTELTYKGGSYLMAQLEATTIANGGTSASFWAQWGGLFGGGGAAVTSADVSGAVTTLSGSGTFYAEWIATGRVGIPLVTLTAVAPGTAVPDSGSPTGEAVSGVTSVQISQVQDDLFGFPLFSSVPYQLGCGPLPLGSAGGLPFTECQSNLTTAGSSFDLLAAGEQVRSLTENVAVTGGSGGFPMALAVFSAHQLLPDNMDVMLAGAPWQQWCANGSALADCLGDDDMDGAANLSDCDDSLATTLPGPSEVTGDGFDHNCDGWACLLEAPSTCIPVEYP